MKRKTFVALMTLLVVIALTLVGCADTWHGDSSTDACALVVTSDGRSLTFPARRYTNEQYTAQANAISAPHSLYLKEGESANVEFTCTACGHNEILQDITAPYAHMFSCSCRTGDSDPDMTEYLVLNVILGEEPANAED